MKATNGFTILDPSFFEDSVPPFPPKPGLRALRLMIQVPYSKGYLNLIIRKEHAAGYKILHSLIVLDPST